MLTNSIHKGYITLYPSDLWGKAQSRQSVIKRSEFCQSKWKWFPMVVLTFLSLWGGLSILSYFKRTFLFCELYSYPLLIKNFWLLIFSVYRSLFLCVISCKYRLPGMSFWSLLILLMVFLACRRWLCLTLCDPMDWRQPGSSVHGIL